MSLNRHQHSSISDQLEQQVAGFASMVTLMLRLGETNTLKECAVVLANELQEIIPYDMAYFWIETKTVIGHKVEIIASNDVSQVESNSLLGYMLQPGLKALKRQVMEQANPLAIEAYSADEFFNAELESEQIHSVGFIKSELLSIPCALDLNKKRVVAGAFFMRSESWTLQEKAIINELQPYLLGVIDRHLHTKRKKEFPFFKTALASVVSAALLFIPVPLSVLAPAEIIPSDSQVMRSALTGVITEIHIKDNQHVKAGDVLVTFDDSELQTRYQVALQSLRIAQENWRQAQQAAFQDRDAKAQLPLLQLNVKKQNLQVEYLQQQLAKTTLVAPRDGVALIENSQQLLGKHVSIGESLFQIAVSSGVDIKGYLSVQDNVDLSLLIKTLNDNVDKSKNFINTPFYVGEAFLHVDKSVADKSDDVVHLDGVYRPEVANHTHLVLDCFCRFPIGLILLLLAQDQRLHPSCKKVLDSICPPSFVASRRF